METERKRRVLLVDDSPAFRGLMQWYLGTLPQVEIVAEATDGEQAIAEVQRLHPDVVLMDVRMPRMDGLEATRRGSSCSPTTPPPFRRGWRPKRARMSCWTRPSSPICCPPPSPGRRTEYERPSAAEAAWDERRREDRMTAIDASSE